MSSATPIKCLSSSDALPNFSWSNPSRDVELRVGSPARSFFIDKNALCKRSPFFEAALSKKWKEGHAKVIELPDDNADAVLLYCCWVSNYSPFVYGFSCKEKTSNGDNPKALVEHQRYVDAYMFGDKVLDHDFCDMILDHLLKHAETVKLWPISQFMRIFEVSGAQDPPRKLIPDLYEYVGEAKWYEKPCKDVSAEAWHAIASAVYKRWPQKDGRQIWYRPTARPWHTFPCRYHWHTKFGGRCYREKDSWEEGLTWRTL